MAFSRLSSLDMSVFRRNILASYASQIYVTAAGIVMVPLYIQYMGAEAYGLVGFFAMLQTWFQLLDIGLTPTMARETARFNGGATDALSLRRLLRTMEGIFIGVAVVGAIVLMLSASGIAGQWLKVQQLPLVEVEHAIMLMALIVAMRWVCGLYRGAINGFEQLVWLGSFNAAIATVRFVLVIPLFIYVGATPTHFFGFQLAVAMVELLVLVAQTYHLLPKVKSVANNPITPWDWTPLRGMLKFSLSIAFTSSVWVLVTQTDKLVLSKLLPLADYAYFSLAVLVAGGVLLVSGPISAALMPRMARLNAQGDEQGLLRVYREATQLVAAIAIPAALVLAFFSEQVLMAWTGDLVISQRAAPVLSLYALGNGVLALAAFPYYLQFAKGDLKLHLIGNFLFFFLLIPGLLWATWTYGVIGAGYAWLTANCVYFLLWIPIVHARFFKKLHSKWLTIDVGGIMLLAVTVSFLISQNIRWPTNRLLLAVYLVLSGLAICLATFSCWFSLRRFNQTNLIKKTI
jgi:O-antigen/teichoic acid export membrane protein